MKVSIVAAVYKDIGALKLIIESLERQTYKNFELIVAEDDNSDDMKEFIRTVGKIEIKHTYQEDRGIRKARSQNNGILKSSGDYIIFLDGDCVPYSTFVEGHVKLAERKHVLSGRRVELGLSISSKLRNRDITPIMLEKKIYWYYPFIRLDGGRRVEEGFYLKPDGFIQRISRNRKRSVSLLGCNFSCYKEDILAINGFDESYEGTALSDDTDLQWRFSAYGLKFKSCRNVSNMFHLYHTSEHRVVDCSEELKLMFQRNKKGIFICENGLDKHSDYGTQNDKV
ncbi:MAG: glycosyl transferase family 2 [Candidatus Schekmanbacteria bacterium RBG_16_38_10]|uniref:Glycosyl transferase family 2 n=1 Tax=Candidatus Schekmanbacteria bacterium RBG_16_38_10 TaxID=1817879 RepID=A0A1F7RMF9_9BACT|nr:MAG: glycosyl transferase family 2 [Candidatus Schekmanbacteria bacterium RBG_16_38_10]